MGKPRTSFLDREKKRLDSIARTHERLEGKLALMAEWDLFPLNGEDYRYYQGLKKEVTKLRSQLKIKNVPTIYEEE